MPKSTNKMEFKLALPFDQTNFSLGAVGAGSIMVWAQFMGHVKVTLEFVEGIPAQYEGGPNVCPNCGRYGEPSGTRLGFPLYRCLSCETEYTPKEHLQLKGGATEAT